MALRLLIKPGEKIHFGTSNIIVVADAVVTVIIEGAVPVLRDGDYMGAASANTPARKAYVALQEIYLHGNVDAGRDGYFASVKALLDELPSAADLVSQINGHLTSGDFYKALKSGRSVVQHVEQARTWTDVING